MQSLSLFPRLQLTILTLLIVGPTFSQSQVFKTKHLDFPQIYHSHALAIYESVDGVVWVGTYSGLKKITPYGVEVIDFTQDSIQLPHSTINCIKPAGNDFLWLGTSNGLVLFNYRNKRIEAVYGKQDNELLEIKDVQDDGNGTIWVATGNGLWQLQTNKNHFQRLENTGLDKVFINCLYLKESDLWIGTEAFGILRFDLASRSMHRTSIDLGQPNQSQGNATINSFMELQGSLLAGTWANGILWYNPLTQKFSQQLGNELGDMNVRHMIKKSDHELWIASMFSGLHSYNVETGSLSQVPLPTESVWYLHQDAKDNLWIGTMGKGIVIYDQQANLIPHYKPTWNDYGSVTPHDISTIVNDGADVWLGTSGRGLFRWNKSEQTVTAFFIDQGRDAHINACFKDSEGGIWVGTGKALYKFDPKSQRFAKIRYLATGEEIANEMAFNGIDEGPDGRIWLTTYSNGIFQFDLKNASSEPMITLTYPAESPILDGNKSFHIHVDDLGRCWLIRQNSINMVDAEGKIHHFPRMGAHTIVDGPGNAIWSISYANGLFTYNESKHAFQAYGKNDQLPERVTGLQFDTTGTMWIHSFQGLFTPSKQGAGFINLTTKHGLQANYMRYHVFSTYDDGQLIFGGENGFNILDPYQGLEAADFPLFSLTDLTVMDRSLDLDSLPRQNDRPKLTVHHLDKVLNIEFGVMDYVAPKDYAFSYQLLGFDQETYTTKIGERTVTYTNLDPGKYQLEYWIKPGNTNQKIEKKSLYIEVLPPFWITWWFRLGMVGLLAIIIAIIYKARLKWAQKEFRLKEAAQERELVQLRNDKLRAHLQLQSEELNTTTMSVIKRNNAIDQITTGIVELMDKMKSDHDRGRVKHFLNRISEYKQDELTWDEFVRDFDASHNDFIRRFEEAFSDLQQKELKLCAYLRMGLANADIASLMAVSVRSVETSRYRIRKKIGDQIDETLSEFILKF